MHELDQRDSRRDGTARMDVRWPNAPGHKSMNQPSLLVNFPIKLFES